MLTVHSIKDSVT